MGVNWMARRVEGQADGIEPEPFVCAICSWKPMLPAKGQAWRAPGTGMKD